MIGKSIGHYLVREKIGVGGMGVVYRAEDVRLGRSVALKVLTPEKTGDEPSRRRMRREAMTLSSLNHPNVQTVFDYHTDDDAPDDGTECIVSEFIPGTSVDELLVAEELDESRVVELGVQLARGLAAAHEGGVVHRDVTPANLRITPEGFLKILDFGIARTKRDRSIGPSRLTDTVDAAETVSGTVPYMAPEQLRGEEPTPAADVYSAGAVLYEMATGERPFPEHQFADLIDSILHRPPPNPRLLNAGLSAPFARLIMRALAKDPKRRFANGAELAAALDALQAQPRPRLSLRPRMAFAGIATLVVALCGFFWSETKSLLPKLFAGESGPRVEALAVLPLENLSGVADTDHVAAGMTDALLTELAALGAFRVASRTSTMHGAGSRTLRELAGDLAVDTVLEGSVRVSGGRVILHVRLVDVATDRNVWVGSYEHGIDERPTQDDVARTIAEDIRAWLSMPFADGEPATMVSGKLADRAVGPSC